MTAIHQQIISTSLKYKACTSVW